MSSNIKVREPVFFHREYGNDLRVNRQPQKSATITKSPERVDQVKRVALLVAPFLTLYKPLSFPVAAVMGVCRIWTSATQFIHDLEKKSYKEACFSFLQLAISVIALAATIFAHPLGMLITTGNDIVLGIIQLAQYVRCGNYEAALGVLAKIVGNGLYLALFFQGGPAFAIAALAWQIMLGLVSSANNFEKGNYLEALADVLMSAVRTNQMTVQIKRLEMLKEIEKVRKVSVVVVKSETKGVSQVRTYSAKPGENDQTWEKVLEYAKKQFPQEGTLKRNSDGFVYLKVDDQYIHDLYERLNLKALGYEKPPYFRHEEAAGAHVSVFHVDEAITPKEVGQKFQFDLSKITVVSPNKKLSYAVVQINSPELEKMRTSYGLEAKLHGHDYHITVGKKAM